MALIDHKFHTFKYDGYKVSSEAIHRANLHMKSYWKSVKDAAGENNKDMFEDVMVIMYHCILNKMKGVGKEFFKQYPAKDVKDDLKKYDDAFVLFDPLVKPNQAKKVLTEAKVVGLVETKPEEKKDIELEKAYRHAEECRKKENIVRRYGTDALAHALSGFASLFL